VKRRRTKYQIIGDKVDAEGWSAWVRPNPDRYLHACCCCGLSHTMAFKIDTNGDILFRVKLNRRATGQRRRRNAIHKVRADLIAAGADLKAVCR
jgi:hypothetical protein